MEDPLACYTLIPSYIALAIWNVWWVIWLLVGLNAKQNHHRELFIKRLIHLVPLLVGPVVLFAPMFITQQNPFGLDVSERCLALLVLLVGMGITCVARYQLGRNWSGLVAIKKEHSLITTGLYASMRHPIYTGLILAVVATGLVVNDLVSLVGAVIWCATYLIKLEHEEEMLGREFGIAWIIYSDKVLDKLIPGVY